MSSGSCGWRGARPYLASWYSAKLVSRSRFELVRVTVRVRVRVALP